MNNVPITKAPRKPPKRAPMGVTPEEFLADLQRVYRLQMEIGIEIYRKHGRFSDSSINKRFGSWNRALAQAGLPINYQTCRPQDLLGEESVGVKRTTYPCHKCKRPFQGLGRRYGNWHCDICAAANNAMASNMAWLG